MKSSFPLTEGNKQAALTNHKYQKAIKEINKLVMINTNAKKEYTSLKEKYDFLQQDYVKLEQKYKCLDSEHATESNIQEVHKLVNDPDSFDETNQMLTNSGNYFTIIQRKPRETLNQLSLPYKSLENTGTISEFIDSKNKLEDYEEKMAEKEKKIEEMMEQLASKNKENSTLYDKCIELICLNEKNKHEKSNEMSIKQVEKAEEKTFIQEELKKCQEIVAKLISEIVSLKRISEKAFKMASTHPSMVKIKSLNEQFGNESQMHSLSNIPSGSHPLIPFLSTCTKKPEKANVNVEQLENKIKSLELEIVKISEEFGVKKAKYKVVIAELGKENENMNKFISKQQSFIEEFILNKNWHTKQNEKSIRQKTMPNEQMEDHKYKEEIGLRHNNKNTFNLNRLFKEISGNRQECSRLRARVFTEENDEIKKEKKIIFGCKHGNMEEIKCFKK